MIENPLSDRLKDFRIFLASGSPRRQELLRALGVSFELVKNNVEETYPEHLKAAEISDYLAQLKTVNLTQKLEKSDILITADTVVWHKGVSLAKPSNKGEALDMLMKLSYDWHEVITSVCFSTSEEQKIMNCTTEVLFKQLEAEEIEFYTTAFEPFDKAGAYGIQEWLGNIAIEEIRGSYSNVVGLPTHLVYKTLMDMAS
ncbi:Maf family nucleotide pyrophosphatase [Muriicola soli]|uniref:dTTP/UTP pyrophosphatase n=1 Tax=Muriicola soli TaxID=2507538 RepID=A0A411E898_9FLAO|nr:Maf family nucleotide pyrophosphatase [Muriicola soli]QBA63941.1 septum formation protein Maf [Muriicola soli]